MCVNNKASKNYFREARGKWGFYGRIFIKHDFRLRQNSIVGMTVELSKFNTDGAFVWWF